MILYLIILIIILLIIYIRRNHLNRFTKYGLKGPVPWIFFLGNFPDVVWRPFAYYEKSNFEKYGQTYVDYFATLKGCIVTSNPEHIKSIMVKDFTNFYYRVMPNYLPKYARKTLIFLQEDWKRVRTQVSPVFTGSRLRLMYNNFKYPIQNCIDNFEELIDQKSNENVETKELMKAFSLDMIAHVVFSLKTNSFKNDEFSKRVSKLFSDRLAFALLSFVLPSFISKKLDLSLFNTKTVEYFAKLTITLMEERKKNKDVVYNDFIEMLIKHQVDGDVIKQVEQDGHINKELSTEEIVGQCIVFFLGGTETVSNTLTHILLELALNQDVQDKLYKDLVDCYPEQNLAFDDVSKSIYLECVIFEALRKYPALNRMFRVALNDYKFKDGVEIKKGQVLGISAYNYLHDPTYFPRPDEFRPERFIEDDIDMNLLPLFGVGPRNCVAERFAMLELKSLLIPFVKKFRIKTNENTMTYKYRNAIIVNMIDDLRLNFSRRD